MITYLLLIIFLIINAFFYNKIMHSKETYLEKKEIFIEYKIPSFLLFLGMFVALSLVTGLRAESVGTDTIHYCEFFNNLTIFNAAEQRMEWLFVGLSLAVKNFTSSSAVYILFWSIIYSFLLVINIKNANNPVLFTFLYFSFGLFFSALNIWRQGIAALIILYTIARKQKINFKNILFNIVLWCIAYFIHKSSLLIVIFILLSYLIRYKSKSYFLGFVFLCYLALLIFKNQILDLMLLIYPDYYHYISYSNNNFQLANNIFNFIYLFLLLIIDVDKNDKKANLLINLVAINLLTGALYYLPLIDRIQNYTNLFVISAFPYLFKYAKNGKLKIVFLYLIIALAIYHSIIYYTNNLGGVFPYSINDYWKI